MELLGEIGSAFAQVDKATANLTSGTFTVTKDNVLAAAQIIKTQADVLQEKLDAARWDLVIEAPGTDDVSTRIAPAWNDLLLHHEDSYANRVQQYVDSLSHLAQQCADSAKAYGYSDEQIAEAFGAQGG